MCTGCRREARGEVARLPPIPINSRRVLDIQRVSITSRDPNVSLSVCRSVTAPANLRLAHLAMSYRRILVTEGVRRQLELAI